MTDAVKETTDRIFDGIQEGMTTDQLMEIIKAGANAYIRQRKADMEKNNDL